MEQNTYLSNPEFIISLYESYRNDKNSVEKSWQTFFEGFDFAIKNYEQQTSEPYVEKEFRVLNLITAYRQRGHLFTKTNPVRSRRKYSPTLDIENFNLEKSDLETVFQAGTEIGIGASKLSTIIEHLQQTYCHSVGVEYNYIRKPEVVEWLKLKMETSQNKPNFSNEEKENIFKLLVKSVQFEAFIHKKFIGQKRFSLEGAEGLIPSLNAILTEGALLNAEEFVIGMSHRGRLNVLSNILQKPYHQIFEEYNGKIYNIEDILGDAKYHLGYNNECFTQDDKHIKVSLVPNPSHLEAVNAVVEGIVRSKLDHDYEMDVNKIIPILIHGDAAIASQGVVYEVIQMAQLEGYKTGGTIHLVVNNQVGFTTNYIDARSSTYCTDIGKVTQSPIFHVNGDDVEALVNTIKLAVEYRQKFHTDVFIDILCYRKYGHNEGDEPRFTQPTLYKIIASHPDVSKIYSQQLINEGVLSSDFIESYKSKFETSLEKELEQSKKSNQVKINRFFEREWKKIKNPDENLVGEIVDTRFSKQKLIQLANQLLKLPTDKKFVSKIEKLMSDRMKMLETNKLDWAMGEMLAFGTLLSEEINIRLSGQDSQRGTFSHRHSALVIEDTDEKYFPLKNINENQGKFSVFNSPLSEYGVLGYEYGYSLTKPDALTIWEAQFGDFNNVAQVMIDQYISSAYEKWNIMNALVMLLPHGYEGQGPEHSSARVERFLTLCAKDNMFVANCSTPANFFHILRRQVKSSYRIPLIVFTPKSLLRHAECVSTMEELAEGNFHKIIDDVSVKAENVKQIAFCTGKIYYELDAKRKLFNNMETAIVRIEQLYPFPEKEFNEILKKYPNSKQIIWSQEEPENMGAWNFIQRMLPNFKFKLVARPAGGSPATGLFEVHNKMQNRILEETLEAKLKVKSEK